MFVSGSVAGTKGSSNGSLPWMKGQMKVRRRLQFPNHGIFGSRASSVSEHCDLSGGNLGRGIRSGHANCGGWPSDSHFWLSKRGSGGWSGSISVLVMFNTKPGVASRSQTGDLGRIVETIIRCLNCRRWRPNSGYCIISVSSHSARKGHTSKARDLLSSNG